MLRDPLTTLSNQGEVDVHLYGEEYRVGKLQFDFSQIKLKNNYHFLNNYEKSSQIKLKNNYHFLNNYESDLFVFAFDLLKAMHPINPSQSTENVGKFDLQRYYQIGSHKYQLPIINKESAYEFVKIIKDAEFKKQLIDEFRSFCNFIYRYHKIEDVDVKFYRPQKKLLEINDGKVVIYVGFDEGLNNRDLVNDFIEEKEGKKFVNYSAAKSTNDKNQSLENLFKNLEANEVGNVRSKTEKEHFQLFVRFSLGEEISDLGENVSKIIENGDRDKLDNGLLIEAVRFNNVEAFKALIKVQTNVTNEPRFNLKESIQTTDDDESIRETNVLLEAVKYKSLKVLDFLLSEENKVDVDDWLDEAFKVSVENISDQSEIYGFSNEKKLAVVNSLMKCLAKKTRGQATFNDKCLPIINSVKNPSLKKELRELIRQVQNQEPDLGSNNSGVGISPSDSDLNKVADDSTDVENQYRNNLATFFYDYFHCDIWIYSPHVSEQEWREVLNEKYDNRDEIFPQIFRDKIIPEENSPQHERKKQICDFLKNLPESIFAAANDHFDYHNDSFYFDSESFIKDLRVQKWQPSELQEEAFRNGSLKVVTSSTEEIQSNSNQSKNGTLNSLTKVYSILEGKKNTKTDIKVDVVKTDVGKFYSELRSKRSNVEFVLTIKKINYKNRLDLGQQEDIGISRRNLLYSYLKANDLERQKRVLFLYNLFTEKECVEKGSSLNSIKSEIEKAEQVYKLPFASTGNEDNTVPALLAAASYVDEKLKDSILGLFKELYAIKSLKPLIEVAAYATKGIYNNGYNGSRLKFIFSGNPEIERVMDPEEAIGGHYNPNQNLIYVKYSDKVNNQKYLHQFLLGTIAHEISHAFWDYLVHQGSFPGIDVSYLVEDAERKTEGQTLCDPSDPDSILKSCFNLTGYEKENNPCEIVVRMPESIAKLTNFFTRESTKPRVKIRRALLEYQKGEMPLEDPDEEAAINKIKENFGDHLDFFQEIMQPLLEFYLKDIKAKFPDVKFDEVATVESGTGFGDDGDDSNSSQKDQLPDVTTVTSEEVEKKSESEQTPELKQSEPEKWKIGSSQKITPYQTNHGKKHSALEDIEVREDPNTKIEVREVIPAIILNENIWRDVEDRGNKFRVASAVYKKSENSDEVDQNKITNTFIAILGKLAGECKLDSSQVLEIIIAAKERGGLYNKFDKDNNRYLSKNELEAENNSEQPLAKASFDSKVARKFSAAFQRECLECGIYTGRESLNVKMVGLRLTFIPDDIVEKIQSSAEVLSSKAMLNLVDIKQQVENSKSKNSKVEQVI